MNTNDSPPTIGACMTPRPSTIDVDALLVDAVAQMRAVGARHLPVLDRGAIVGILTDRELPRASKLRGDERVRDAMNPGPFVVTASTRLEDVVREMAASKIEGVIVERDGAVVGVLTAVDVARLLAEALAAEDHCAAPRCNRYGTIADDTQAENDAR